MLWPHLRKIWILNSDKILARRTFHFWEGTVTRLSSPWVHFVTLSNHWRPPLLEWNFFHMCHFNCSYFVDRILGLFPDRCQLIHCTLKCTMIINGMFNEKDTGYLLVNSTSICVEFSAENIQVCSLNCYILLCQKYMTKVPNSKETLAQTWSSSFAWNWVSNYYQNTLSTIVPWM